MGSPQRSAFSHSYATNRDNDNFMNTEILTAAKNGSLNNFKALLEKQTSPGTIAQSKTRQRKDTLLHIAALFGHHELSKYLADVFPNLITCRNIIGNTPLHVAARGGKIHVVRALVPMEGPSNSLLDVNEDGNTPLHLAVIHNRPNVVEYLVMRIPKFTNIVLDVNKKGKSPLYLAVESINAGIVEKILNGGVDIHVDTRKSVLHKGVTKKNIGTIQNNEYVEMDICALHVKITGKDTGGKCQVDVDIKNAQNSKNLLNRLGCSCSINNGEAEHVKNTESVLHAAIIGKDTGIFKMVAEKVIDGVLPEENNHLLHLAASLGFLDGLEYLIREFGMDLLRLNDDGYCPIHLACQHGHLRVIRAIHNRYPDVREFLSNKLQNMLHVAAENGKDNVVQYILQTEWAEFLLNEEDGDGNTPLHLATKNWHPKVVSSLTWADRIDLSLVNKEGLTALEVAEKYMEEMAPFNQRLTWMALKSAGTPRAHIKDVDTVKRIKAAKYEPYNMDYCKDRVNTLLLVSALVATVTFAAGFTMPGGTKSSGSDEGMASMMHKTRFQLFVICDSIAVYSSIIVLVILMWAQLGDLDLLLNALRNAQRLLGLSLTMMCLAFLAGVDLVLTEVRWLSLVISVMGILSLIALLALFVPLFLPYMSRSIIARYISYYPFLLLVLASER